MTRRLKDNLNSKYFEAANRLKSKKARRRIVAYVESYDDVLFWRMLLGNYEDDTKYFEVMLPSHNTLERGKRSVLMNLFYNKVGKDMIACVDADYDYLIQGATVTSRNILSSPFVFHTYAYSIENLQCYGPSLHNVCVMVTLNDHAIFNFSEFLKLYSEAIFPLFVWSIWYYRQDIYGQFTITEFNRIVEIGNFNLGAPEQSIINVRNKVSKKVHWLNQHNPGAKESYLALKKELIELGVTPDTTYLYIQGHHLFDKVVVPVMSRVCEKLVRERENEIRRQAVHATQMRNELSCYSHSVQDIVQMLKKNMGYYNSGPFQRMKRDIETYLQTYCSVSGTDVHDETCSDGHTSGCGGYEKDV